MGKSGNGGLSPLVKVFFVLTILLVPYLSWLGWNGIVAAPAWIYLLVIFATDAPPTSQLFKDYVAYVDWSATQLIPEDPVWEFPVLENWTPDDFSYEKVKKLSKGFTRPVVFKGLGKANTHLEQWADPNYFAEKYGNTSLMAVRNSLISKQREAAMKATVVGSEDPEKGAFLAEEIRLDDAIKRMIAGDNVYFQNVDQLVRRNPEILDHMELDKVFKNWKDGKPFKPLVVNWFMGFGRGNPKTDDTTGTSIHCAMPANFFFMFSGKKQWWFVEPKWTPYILGTFSKHVPAGFARRLPSYVPKAEVILTTGDVMFNPSFMWHEVRNYEGWSLAAANRQMFPKSMISNNPFSYFMMDLFGHPFTFSRPFFLDKPLALFIVDTPLLRTLAMVLKGDALEPPVPATASNCDEHNLDGCSTSFEQALMNTKKFNKDQKDLKDKTA